MKGLVDGSGIVCVIRYDMERKLLEDRMQHLVTYDALIDLPNRHLFQDRLTQAIERARRNSAVNIEKWGMAVVLLDLDIFKSMNDSLGHSHGDLLLQFSDSHLRASIRKSDTLARMEGDEFFLIFENDSGSKDIKNLANKILSVFSQPFVLDDPVFNFTNSIGVSLFPCDGEEAESLFRQAYIAMYATKLNRSKVCFYRECKEEIL